MLNCPKSYSVRCVVPQYLLKNLNDFQRLNSEKLQKNKIPVTDLFFPLLFSLCDSRSGIQDGKNPDPG